ncbi:MAG: alpha/beta hydrolase-fold protein [bacterium]|nr:alpha/beta hydrolase-fold protein [bacterium]
MKLIASGLTVFLFIITITSNAIAQNQLGLELRTKHITQTRLGRYHLLTPKPMHRDTIYRVALVLHGNGHGPEVMIQWARELNLTNTIFICPEAPYLKWSESKADLIGKFTGVLNDSTIPDLIEAESIATTGQWYYDVMRDAINALQAPASSNDAIIGDVKLGKPFVIGFSQGGFFAQVLATRHPDDFAGVVSISGSIYPVAGVLERYDRLRGMPILICHGKQDTTVPFSVATQCIDALSRAEVEHTFIPFTGAHWPTPDVTDQVRRWIQAKQ